MRADLHFLPESDCLHVHVQFILVNLNVTKFTRGGKFMVALNSIQQITQFSFLISCLAMGAAAIFFYNERDKVHSRYRLPMLLASLITGIACAMYFFMRDKYIIGQVFPTELRYIDWILTTPLMLVEFAVLLDFKDRAGVIWRLVLWDLVMIIFGYVGETNGFAVGGFQLRWTMLVVGCGGWLGILVYLYTGIRRQANLADPETRTAIVLLTKFITAGWMIYPIGYVVRALRPDLGDICQLCYNIGDVINKVGLGIIVYSAAVSYSQRAKSPSASELVEATAGTN
ncbi:bacteriorhodopsin-like [soil metagenome]